MNTKMSQEMHALLYQSRPSQQRNWPFKLIIEKSLTKYKQRNHTPLHRGFRERKVQYLKASDNRKLLASLDMTMTSPGKKGPLNPEKKLCGSGSLTKLLLTLEEKPMTETQWKESGY